MPHLRARSKIAARPMLPEPDQAARRRRLAERKAAEYRRACQRRAARGEAALWAWVPEAHAELIRNFVTVCVTELDKGHSLQQILPWPKSGAARTGVISPLEPDAPLSVRVEGAQSDDPAEGSNADDPAVWQGTGLKARRRAQGRRAAKRQKSAGRKRIRLVVPAAVKPVISEMLEQLLAGLSEGLVPRVDVRALVHEVTMAVPPCDPSTGASFPASPAPICLATKGRNATGETDLQSSASQAGEAPQAQGPPSACLHAAAPRRVICPRTGSRRDETARLPESVEDHSPLFEDIRAYDRLARSMAARPSVDAKPVGSSGGPSSGP